MSDYNKSIVVRPNMTTESNAASQQPSPSVGSKDEQLSTKRKHSPENSSQTMMPSSSSSTSESGGISKKKFAPTIPLSRGKKLSDCEMKKNKWLERKPFESNARNKIYFANKPHFNQHRPYYNSRADSKPLPAPYKKPELIQTEGSLFGDGVLCDGRQSKRKPSNQTDKLNYAEDPIMTALNVIDNYEMYGSAPNNFPTPLLLGNIMRPQINPAHTFHGIEEASKEVNQLVLMKDGEEKEVVTVHPHLMGKLKFHQVEGIKFMWNACFKSAIKSGCVLAHCMGLGKSLQIVTLAHTVLTSAICEVSRVMVVCPLSTVLNWQNEFKIWFPKETLLPVYELASVKTSKAREEKLNKWFEVGGIVIIGYEMFRTLTNETTTKKASKKEGDGVYQKCLVDPGPDVVVCDEGHLLKNEESELYKAMNKISTRCRIMLTGTPLQNSLFEYFTMVQFVKPGQLGTKVEFNKRFVLPLQKGLAADSMPSDVRVMKRRALILHKLLEHTVQRFDSNVLAPFLPPKHEYVVSVRMSNLQIQLYQHYLENFTKGGSIQDGGKKIESGGLFSDFQELARVWTHPKALLLALRRREAKLYSQSKDPKSGCGKKKTSRKNALIDEDDYLIWSDKGEDDTESCFTDDVMNPTSSSNSNMQWWSHLVTNDNIDRIEHSGKFVLLIDILRKCKLIGDKLLVFSQSLTSLDLIEEFLAIEDLRNRDKNAVNEGSGTWNLNTDYFRLDGATSSEQRQKWCSTFNDTMNTRARLFLISTRAGGIGINLIGANRAVIFDASWNPSQDLQSVFRIYRLGQKKPCYVYRFVAQGTMEEKVYYRQVAKLALSRCVVDDDQMERYFGSNDLTDLYSFDADGLLSLPDPLLWSDSSPPDDAVLTELASRRKEWIGAYREHDSLLQSRPEEFLEQSEQQAIWKLFEKEQEAQSRRVL